jgi:hypothetical protein
VRLPPGHWTDTHLGPVADDHRWEIVDGSLHLTPPCDEVHTALVDAIVGLLGSAAPPSWRPLSPAALRAGESYLRPDVAVLRPGAPPDAEWVEPDDVALVVEVETPHSRRFDRHLKPGLYADAGVESYWRIERTSHGPVAHLYTRAGAGHYDLHRAVAPGRVVTAELPYAVQVAPAVWNANA